MRCSLGEGVKMGHGEDTQGYKRKLGQKTGLDLRNTAMITSRTPCRVKMTYISVLT